MQWMKTHGLAEPSPPGLDYDAPINGVLDWPFGYCRVFSTPATVASITSVFPTPRCVAGHGSARTGVVLGNTGDHRQERPCTLTDLLA